jgi:hypothetical protein
MGSSREPQIKAMTPGLAILIIAIVAVPLAVGIPVQRRNRKLGKQGRRAMGAGLGVMDEIFHPNAHEARIIIEQKQLEILPTPSPEDKPNLEVKPNLNDRPKLDDEPNR